MIPWISKFAREGTPASLGQRLTRVLMPLLAGVIAMGGVVLHSAIKSVLLSQFDHALVTKARTLTRFPEQNRTGINLGFTENPLPEFHPGPDAEFFELWLSDGSVLAKSPSLLANGELPRRIGPGQSPLFWNLLLPDGRPGRAVGLRLDSKKGPLPGGFSIDFVLARDRAEQDQVLQGLALGIALSGAGLLGLAWFGIRRATALALTPVGRLAREVAAIDASSLKTRIEPRLLPADLQPIAQQINHLMQRLEEAFDRERRFAANAAHELLTPVSELRIAADNALQWPDDPEATAGLAEEARDLAVQMEHVVRNLLALCRAEAKLTPLRVESFSVAGLVEEILEGVADIIRSRGLKVNCQVSRELKAGTDQVLVRSILQNLARNAAEYSVAGTELTVEAREVDGFLQIRFINEVENLSPEEVAQFSEPFWRGDKAHRSRDHAGLGLALSKAFAQMLRGDLTLEPQEGTLAVTLRIPKQLQTAETSSAE